MAKKTLTLTDDVDIPVPQITREEHPYLRSCLPCLLAKKKDEKERNDTETKSVGGEVKSKLSGGDISIEKSEGGEGSEAPKLDFLVHVAKKKERNDKSLEEWKIIGSTMDRCLCIFFYVSLVFVTMACFSSVPSYHEHNEGE